MLCDFPLQSFGLSYAVIGPNGPSFGSKKRITCVSLVIRTPRSLIGSRDIVGGVSEWE